MYERCVVEDSGRQVAWEERGIERLRWRRGVERGSVGGEGYKEVRELQGSMRQEHE